MESEKPASKTLKSARSRKLLTDIYEIHVSGNRQPSKKIRIQFPLTGTFSTDKPLDDSDIVIVTADEDHLVDEKSLEILSSKPKKTGDTLSFYVSHFSM